MASNMSQDPTLELSNSSQYSSRQRSPKFRLHYHYYTLPRSLRWHSMTQEKPKPAIRPQCAQHTLCQGLSPTGSVPASSAPPCSILGPQQECQQVSSHLREAASQKGLLHLHSHTDHSVHLSMSKLHCVPCSSPGWAVFSMMSAPRSEDGACSFSGRPDIH